MQCLEGGNGTRHLLKIKTNIVCNVGHDAKQWGTNLCKSLQGVKLSIHEYAEGSTAVHIVCYTFPFLWFRKFMSGEHLTANFVAFSFE